MSDYVRKSIKQKPFADDGYDNAEWIAIDYGSVIVHIFKHEIRHFYDIEHLWDDADIEYVPNQD